MVPYGSLRNKWKLSSEKKYNNCDKVFKSCESLLTRPSITQISMLWYYICISAKLRTSNISLLFEWVT